MKLERPAPIQVHKLCARACPALPLPLPPPAPPLNTPGCSSGRCSAPCFGGGGAWQDVPPPGGYPAIKTARSLPKGGASAMVMAAGSVFVVTYGMYRIVKANQLRKCSDRTACCRGAAVFSPLSLVRAQLLEARGV